MVTGAQKANARVERPARVAKTPVKGRGPGVWDVHVGRRVREGRLLRNVSQEALARAAGVSFQQVQKYEHGVNRVSPDRLVAFAEALGVSPGWFFEGRDGVIGQEWTDASMEGLSGADIAIARDVACLPQPIRQKVVGLIRALSEEQS